MSIKLIIMKGDASYDVSNLVESVSWSGRRGAAARSLKVTLLDDDGYKHARSEIDVEEGHRCIFCWQGQELFRGLIMQQEQSNSKTMSVTAYDNGIYLSNNKDTFNFEDTKASDIFLEVCKRFGIKVGEVADTNYRIPELPKPKTSGWDVICDALSLTYKATGIRYYPLCVGEEIHLLERRENIRQWVIGTGSNLTDYKLNKSVENIKTRIAMYTKDDEFLDCAIDSGLEDKFGIFQDISQADDDLNAAQLKELVQTILEENNKPDRGLSVSALGISDVVTGIGVLINIKPLDISKTYYVEDDTHSFQGNLHSMNLKLVQAQDTETVKTEEQPQVTEISVGDTVQFSGGSHYISSTASSPTGSTRKAGPAKCTHVAKGAAHPYHLIGGAFTSVDGDSNVYGWVDAGTVTQ